MGLSSVECTVIRDSGLLTHGMFPDNEDFVVAAQNRSTRGWAAGA